jgi:hypothetical protein
MGSTCFGGMGSTVLACRMAHVLSDTWPGAVG